MFDTVIPSLPVGRKPMAKVVRGLNSALLSYEKHNSRQTKPFIPYSSP